MEDMLDDLYEDSQEIKEESDYPSCPFLLEKATRVHDFIRFDRYKGRPRKNGSLTITSDGTLFIVSVNDKEAERSFSELGHSLAECLEQLDQRIASRAIHWRSWGNRSNGRKKAVTGTQK